MRAEIRHHVGTIEVEAEDREIRLWSEKKVATSLMRAAGEPIQESMVAGADSEF